MQLKFYRTQRKYNERVFEAYMLGSLEDLVNAAETTVVEDDWYMAVLSYEDEEETVFAKFTHKGDKYFFFPERFTSVFNDLIVHALESSNLTKCRTLQLENSSVGYQISHSTGKEGEKLSYEVDFSEEDLVNLGKIEDYVKSIGFEGMECIMFAPRRAGKYKSACIVPSRREQGKARVTMDMYYAWE